MQCPEHTRCNVLSVIVKCYKNDSEHKRSTFIIQLDLYQQAEEYCRLMCSYYYMGDSCFSFDGKWKNNGVLDVVHISLCKEG